MQGKYKVENNISSSKIRNEIATRFGRELYLLARVKREKVFAKKKG